MQSLSLSSKNRNPFSSTTARADKNPQVDIIRPKKSVLTTIERNLQEIIATGEPRICPVLGSAGSGKTSLYHTLSGLLSNTKIKIIYMSPQTNEDHADSIYIQLWFSLVQQLGISFLQNIVKKMKQTIGSLEDIVHHFTGQYAIVAEMLFALAEEQYHSTAKYLLSGLKIENPILPNQIKGGTSFYDEDLCFAALKLVLYFSPEELPIIFFFDEIESLFISFGDRAEIRLLEKIKRIYNDLNNVLIILCSLPDVWERILSLSTVSAVSRFEVPTMLSRFKLEDLEKLITDYLNIYWTNRQLNLPFPSPTWPFQTDEIKEIHSISDGNPREAMKILRNRWYDYNDVIQNFLSEKLGNQF